VGFDAEAVRRLDALGRTQEQGRAGNVRFAWEVTQLLTERRGRFEPSLEVLGQGRAAFAFVANCDPYTYAGRIPIRAAPEAQFELGLDLVAPRVVSPASIPRLITYALRGRGQATAGDVLYAHDVDRVELVCDHPLPLQVDGEDMGDVTSALFEAERSAVVVLN
jgi:diacylglycerol kinase family enzyme